MNLLFSNQAKKDWEKVKAVKVLKKKALTLFRVLKNNPYQNPPSYEKLVGDLAGAYSRRLNKQHRLVYRIENNEVLVISMWTHYEN